MKILVSGSSGLIGSALIDFHKSKNHEIYKLVRVRADLQRDEIAWDPVHRGVINPPLLEGFDAVVHLAGENLMGMWTKEKKQKIWESRVHGTKLLCTNLSQLKDPPSVFICASAIGFYGNGGDEILTEESPKGKGFLAEVCDDWEKATEIVAKKGIRTVNLRFGLVLSPKGGALKLILPIFKLGLGGQIGNGKQYISWISIDDLVRVIDFAIERQNLAGPINTVTPFPITNREFTKTMGQVLHRPTLFSIPSFAIRLLPGESANETLLSSTKVLPKKLEKANFQFDYPNLKAALIHLLNINEPIART